MGQQEQCVQASPTSCCVRRAGRPLTEGSREFFARRSVFILLLSFGFRVTSAQRQNPQANSPMTDAPLRSYAQRLGFMWGARQHVPLEMKRYMPTR